MTQETLKAGDRVIWLFTPSQKYLKSIPIDAVVINVTSPQWARIEFSLRRDGQDILTRRVVLISKLSLRSMQRPNSQAEYMSLKDVANTLYDWAAGHPPDRAQLLDGAQALESMAMSTDQALLDAAASLRDLATKGVLHLDLVERKRAAILAAYLRRIADPKAAR
jgi:hypothetical protein